MSSRERQFVTAFSGVLLFYALWTVLSAWWSGRFGYHDLAMISEFLASQAYGGRFFWVSQAESSHFSVHFTPTLALFTPLYRVWDSSGLLLALGALSLVSTGLIFVAIARILIEKKRLSLKNAPFFWLALLMVLTISRYPKNNLMAASCWFPFLPLSGLTLLHFLKGQFKWSMGFFLLALGVRQDTGFFLAGQFAVLALLVSGQERKRALAFAGLGLLYTLLFALFIAPAIGMASHVNRGWSRYGNSWGQIFVSALTHPSMVWDDLRHSAVWRLNLSLGGLPMVNPLLGVLANLPGMLFYLCDDPAKRYLSYYNAGFLLPGMFLATIAGALRILPMRMGRFYFGALGLALILTLNDHDELRMRPYWDGEKTVALRQQIKTVLAKCPGRPSVAADFRTVVFFPPSLPKFWLEKAERADLVFYVPDYEPQLPGQEFDASSLSARLTAAGYRKSVSSGPAEVWSRPEACPEL